MWKQNEIFALLLLYVDDILLVSNSAKKEEEIKTVLKNEFTMTDLGSPRKFLGIEIMRNRDGQKMFLSQKKFVNGILKRFNMTECKSVAVPMTTVDSQSTNTNLKYDGKDIPFRQAIGSLLYLQNATRPDITYCTNVMSRRQSDFSFNDWTQVKRIMRYLRGTKNLGVRFTGERNCIECYCDASLGMNDKEGKSTTGYAIFLFGDLIMWRTKRQNHVALSSAEAEFVALSLACRDVICLCEMSKQLMNLQIIPILYEDNKTTIELASTEETKSLKHIVNLCYHFIRKEVREKRVELVWVSSNEQVGDFFTKPLARLKFEKFRNFLMYEC